VHACRLRWRRRQLVTWRRCTGRVSGQCGPGPSRTAATCRADGKRICCGRVRALSARIDRLAREIEQQVRPLAPTLLALLGCGPLTAAKLVGETANVQRFHSRAAYARHTGTAPVPVGTPERVRLNRGGNRQLNAALHRIALTQLQQHGSGHEYVARRMASGNTKTEAIRAVRRRLSYEVYRRLRADAGCTP
jgi:transposase